VCKWLAHSHLPVNVQTEGKVAMGFSMTEWPLSRHTLILSHLQTNQVQWLLPGKLQIQCYSQFEHQHEKMHACAITEHEGNKCLLLKDEHPKCG
jgi:hypothetical protein